MANDKIIPVVSKVKSPEFRQELAARFGIGLASVKSIIHKMTATHTNPGNLLGIDNAGNPFFAKDIRSNPKWWKQITNLTAYGKKVVSEIRETMREFDDGVIRDEADLIDLINSDRASMGMPPCKPTPPKPPDEIRTEADLEALIKYDKFRMGRED